MKLSVKDVAELLTVSEKTVYRWISEGKLPAFRLSGQYRFNRAELLEWATANRLNVSPELFREKEIAYRELPELSEALQTGGIFYRLSGSDKRSALHSMVECLRLPDEVDREFLLQVLLARETLETTALGNGIAIPHPRNPIVLHVPKPMVALGFLETPIDFDALDGRLVHALFLLLSPSMRAHLYLLARLSFALRDPQLKSLISQQAKREEILTELRRISASFREPTRS